MINIFQSPQLQKGLTVTLIVIIFFSIIIIPKNWIQIKSVAYVTIRQVSVKLLDYQTDEMETMEGKHFTLKFLKEDSNSAQMVLTATEEVWQPVTDYLKFKPKGNFFVIMYPTKQQLNKTFGWDGDKSAMGVYWLGAIRIISPNQWLDTQNEEIKDQIFKTEGPMVHEFTHLVLDYKTNGNYTRWFTEGVAQFIEKELTGFTLNIPKNSEMTKVYDFSDLDNNYDNYDQVMTYWQSLQAIEFITDVYGKDVINQITDQLAMGKNMDEALKQTIGLDEAGLKEALVSYIIDRYSINH